MSSDFFWLRRFAKVFKISCSFSCGDIGLTGSGFERTYTLVEVSNEVYILLVVDADKCDFVHT